eukprot:2007471-Pleurochrysis_carterae.AAC.1
MSAAVKELSGDRLDIAADDIAWWCERSAGSLREQERAFLPGEVIMISGSAASGAANFAATHGDTHALGGAMVPLSVTSCSSVLTLGGGSRSLTYAGALGALWVRRSISLLSKARLSVCCAGFCDGLIEVGGRACERDAKQLSLEPFTTSSAGSLAFGSVICRRKEGPFTPSVITPLPATICIAQRRKAQRG